MIAIPVLLWFYDRDRVSLYLNNIVFFSGSFNNIVFFGSSYNIVFFGLSTTCINSTEFWTDFYLLILPHSDQFEPTQTTWVIKF